MDKSNVKTEYRAYQEIRRELAAQIERLELPTVSASELRREFGVTPTVLRRLVSLKRVRAVRKSRRRNARVRYRLREVLLVLIADGMYATGRIRNGGRQN